MYDQEDLDIQKIFKERGKNAGENKPSKYCLVEQKDYDDYRKVRKHGKIFVHPMSAAILAGALIFLATASGAIPVFAGLIGVILCVAVPAAMECQRFW